MQGTSFAGLSVLFVMVHKSWTNFFTNFASFGVGSETEPHFTRNVFFSEVSPSLSTGKGSLRAKYLTL